MSVDKRNEDEGGSAPNLRNHSAHEEFEQVEECMTDDEQNPEEEFCFYRLERLAKQLDNAIALRPQEVFIQPLTAQKREIDREEFRKRFKEFICEVGPDIPVPADATIDALLDEAIQGQREIEAWENTLSAIESEDFRRSLEYLNLESARFANLRKAFLGKGRQKTPEWMNPWERIWIEAFHELREEIESELRVATQYLERLSKLAKLGRTEIRSHILLWLSDSITRVTANTRLSKFPATTLAALAYAADLVPSDDGDDDAKGNYVRAISRRLQRAKKSKSRTWIAATLLMARLQSPNSAEKTIPLPGS